MAGYILWFLGLLLVGVATLCAIGSYRCGGLFEFIVTLFDDVFGD